MGIFAQETNRTCKGKQQNQIDIDNHTVFQYTIHTERQNMNTKSKLATLLLSTTLAACGGGSSIDPVVETPLDRPVQPYVFKYGEFSRVNFNSLARTTNCPTDNFEVWLVAGQSNAAAYAQKPINEVSGGKVVQFFDGRCYNVASPLLGSSAWPIEATLNNYNPFISVAKQYSIETGKTVIIKSFAVGGQPIRKWYDGEYRVPFFTEVQQTLSSVGINRFIWQQGETDNFEGTTTEAYVNMFENLVFTLRQYGFNGSVHVARSSICAGSPLNNNIGLAHDQLRTQYPGPNTDVIADTTNRYDECHFSSVGVEAFKELWMNVLR